MREPMERSIERYVDGHMSLPEQAGFLEQAAADPVATRLLAAEQTIARAINSDRRAMPVAPTAPNTALLASLAETTPTLGVPAVVTSGSIGMLKLGGLVAGLALLVTTAVVVVRLADTGLPGGSHVGAAVSSVAIVHAQSLALRAPSPSVAVPADNVPATITTASSATAPRPAAVGPHVENRSTRENRLTTLRNGNDPTAPKTPIATRQRTEPMVFRDDSVRVRFDVEGRR